MASERGMNIRNLAEAVILQSVEDLWDAQQKDDCLTFFYGESFGLCAEMAGMNTYEQAKMLQLVSAAAQKNRCGRIHLWGGKEDAYSVSGR